MSRPRTLGWTVAAILGILGILGLVGAGVALHPADPVDRRAPDGAEATPVAGSPNLEARAPTGERQEGPEAADPVRAGAALPLVRVRMRAVAATGPVSGADVRVAWEGGRAAATTGPDGDASLQLPDGAELEWRVVAEGYRVAIDPLLDGDGGLRFHLRSGVPFDGRVVDGATGEPIAGASVRVSDEGDEFDLAPTDAEGRFHVPGAGDDSDVTIEVVARDHLAVEAYVRVDSGRPIASETVIRLEPAGTLSGTVTDIRGRPVVGASVVAWPRPAPTPQTGPDDPREHLRRLERGDAFFEPAFPPDLLRGTSGSEGRFRLDGAALGGEYLVAATAAGHAPTEVVEAWAGNPIRLSLRASTAVLVHLDAPEGVAVPKDARVRILQDGRLRDPTRHESYGTYLFEGLRAGETEAFAQARGFLSDLRSCVAVEGRTTEVVLRLGAGETVEGTVLDARGRPVVRALVGVGLEAANGRLSQIRGLVQTDDEGRFTLTGLEAGPCFLQVGGGEPNAPSACTAPARDVRLVLGLRVEATLALVTAEGSPFSGEIDVGVSGPRGGSSWQVGDGTLSVHLTAAGRYEVLVIPEGHAWFRRTFEVNEVRDGESIDLGRVVVDPGIEVSGRVVDGAGRPVPGATVSCQENSDRWTETYEEGRYAFVRFPREPIRLRLSCGGFVPRNVDVEPGRPTGLEVQLTRVARLRGTLRVPGGSPAADVAFLLRGPPTDASDPDAWYDEPRSDRDGRFEGFAAPGRVRALWTDAEGAERVLGEWNLAEGEERAVDLVLPGD